MSYLRATKLFVDNIQICSEGVTRNQESFACVRSVTLSLCFQLKQLDHTHRHNRITRNKKLYT